jgi:RecJ-like exonuclease
MANVIRFTRVTGEGDEVEVVLPASYEVCDRCRGNGKHVNPAIDGDGITSEEFDRDWDDESKEAYFAGDYDVLCEECDGKRVILVINEAECKRQGLEADLAAYYENRRDEASYRAECAAERRMGA